MFALRKLWHRVRLAVVVALSLAAAGGPTLATACKSADASGPGSGCCKVCTTGKACGDTCIQRSDTCHVGSGCACNG